MRKSGLLALEDGYDIGSAATLLEENTYDTNVEGWSHSFVEPTLK